MKAVQEVFVPVSDACEVTRLTLVNESSEAKTVDLFSYAEFCLWNALDDMSNFQRNFSIGEVEVCGSRIYHKTEYRERRNHYAVFSVNKKICGFDTSRDAFAGLYNGPSNPAAVLEGGMSGLYIRTTGETGHAELTIRCADLEVQNISFEVR